MSSASATVFFQNTAGNDIATLTKTFQVSGVNTDPSTVVCVITDPNQTVVTHTFGGAAPADVTKVSTGVYQLLIGGTVSGLWSFLWVGTGTASDADAGTWTVNPSTVNQFYTSVEELKDRLNITTTATDLSCQLAVQAASKWVDKTCGRHFYQITETRTFPVYSIWEQPLDDIVSITQLNVDFNGTGVFDQQWILGTDYQLTFDGYEFNLNTPGEPRPYTRARVINFAGGGRFFPFVWPFSRLDRVQVIATFGWPAVPLAVRQAALQLAADFFKLKDAPFGIAGSSDWGLLRLPRQNPAIKSLLASYIGPRRAVGL
jgi:hypothetical protein